ncbi:ParA family protein [Aquipuribacter nitratireducens]|uniref:ParA family protein n=1 Tax=Aquipuribacter nitratireducens TaxID=650104 RepID=A0ABW0GMX6_9MICO
MPRVLAVANQKGGVAKTTTAAALSTAFAQAGRRVLLVDLDPQACLTFALGVDADEVVTSSAEVLLGAPLEDAVVRTAEDVDLLPATLELAATDAALVARPDREAALRDALAPVADRYDDVVVDCSPTLGVLTLAALAAADEVLVPLAAEMLGHRAVGQLLDTAEDVRRGVNPGLVVVGLLPTMVDLRTSHAREVVEDLSGRYGLPVLGPVPRSVRVAEAPVRGRSVLTTSPRSRASLAYREVATELLHGR